MLLTEYNETETMALFKEEGREEGLEEGRNLTNRSNAKAMKAEGIHLDVIGRITGLSIPEIAAL